MPRVSVIIPVWNLWDMTAACLRSLAEHSAGGADCADGGLEVLVVDNGSSDATAEQLPALGRDLFCKNFKALRLPQNMGFAIACNAGARAASGDLLFFLNNDTRVTRGWLPPLVKALENPKTGATGPLLLYPDGRIQHCGIAVSPFRRLWHIYEYFPGAHALPRKQRPLQAITGAALMVRRKYFFEAGTFFEEYRNGFEDMDICCALRSRGYALSLTPQSIVVHYTSQTPGRFEADKNNAALLTRRWGADIRPDLHSLAARDGYLLRVGPSLTLWLALREELEKSLNAELAERMKAQPSSAAEFLGQRLAEEPLWLDGHLRLMDLLESRGRRREAISAGLSALVFFPLPQVQTRLLRLARREDMTGEELTPLLRRLAEETDSKAEKFRPVVQAARREARGRGDTLLTRIMDDWLVRYGSAGVKQRPLP
ncbi:MAG: glycosyltransferase family 2 protein [Desulfovibrio sp.]|jgi:GT2 family glycosyltransferase|nr:glycosyltransferase family 2 protein [Desulfovibrio sp.]